MKVLWLENTPFGMTGEEVEYPSTTKPYLIEMIAGAVVERAADVNWQSVSTEMLTLLDSYLDPDFGLRDRVAVRFRDAVRFLDTPLS